MTALGSTDSSASIGARIAVESLDHLVLDVRDPVATLRFYVDVLGMREHSPGDGHPAVRVGGQTIQLHAAGTDASPAAGTPTPGSAELCFVTRTPVEGVLRVLEEHGIEVAAGPVERAGATGRLLSVYVRDPDGNLVELANRLVD